MTQIGIGDPPVLAVTFVSVEYRSTVAVREVSLRVRAGETVAVIGPSGAGKTSLLQCIGGLHKPSSGSIEVVGRDLWTLSRRDRTRVRRKLIGFVTQGADLVPELSLRENVALPLRLLGTDSKAALSAAQHGLEQFGVDHLGRRYPDEVSGGERQRAAIARALVHAPSVILADEPTGALDEENRVRIAAALFDAARLAGAGVVVVTHDERIAANADRILLLRDGLLAPVSPSLP